MRHRLRQSVVPIPAVSRALLAALTLLLLAGQAYAQPTITWNPKKVEHVIGLGQSANDNVEVTFVSTTALSSVSLSVVPTLAPFVRVEPTVLPSVQAGTPYTVTLRFVIPPGSLQGIYSGTLHIRLNNATLARPLPVTLTVDYGDNVVPPTTKVLDDRETDHLRNVSPNGSSLLFDVLPPSLVSLTEDDVIVIGVSALTPRGLLRRVSDISVEADGVRVGTSPATLSEALRFASIGLSYTLRPNTQAPLTATPSRVRQAQAPTTDAADSPFIYYVNDLVIYDHDGDLTTTHDEVRLDGRLTLSQSFDFHINIAEYEVTSMSFVSNLSEDSEVRIHADIGAFNLHESVSFPLPPPMPPITLWAGWVPVVIQPELALKVGADGSVSVGLETGVGSTATLQAGVAYTDGVWSPVGSESHSFTFIEPHVTLGMEARGYLGPQLDLLFYGLTGPYVTARGFLEFDADLFATPWWSLYGGVEAAVGLATPTLGLPDIEFPETVGIKVLLAEATSPPPPSEALDKFYVQNQLMVGSQIIEKMRITDRPINIDISGMAADGYHAAQRLGDFVVYTRSAAAFDDVPYGSYDGYYERRDQFPASGLDLMFAWKADGTAYVGHRGSGWPGAAQHSWTEPIA